MPVDRLSMLALLKENRLKAGSALCVIGDTLMGLAGATGLYHIGKNPVDVLLTIGAALGLLGHSFILLWGKGGRSGESQISRARAATPVYLRPLFPWRYPLDAGFVVWSLAGIAFVKVAVMSGNPPLALFGSLCTTISLFTWLWPEKKKIFGRSSMQVSSMLYAVSGMSNFVSGLWAHSPYIVGAGSSYMLANVIYYTVRKENQSLYTIRQEGQPS